MSEPTECAPGSGEPSTEETPEPSTKIVGKPFTGPDDPRRSGGGHSKDASRARKLAREHTDEAIETLVALMRSAKSGKVKLDAACAILDRGYGKPKQPISGNVEVMGVRDQSSTALMEWLRKLEVRAAETPAGHIPEMIEAPLIAVPEGDE